LYEGKPIGLAITMTPNRRAYRHKARLIPFWRQELELAFNGLRRG